MEESVAKRRRVSTPTPKTLALAVELAASIPDADYPSDSDSAADLAQIQVSDSPNRKAVFKVPNYPIVMPMYKRAPERSVFDEETIGFWIQKPDLTKDDFKMVVHLKCGCGAKGFVNYYDDGNLYWNQDELIGILLPKERKKPYLHLDRLARIAFHPSGEYLATTSFDKTWRLWDIHTGAELLLQEGHSRSVYGIAFHKDGSLAASCGLDALARVWDLRIGTSILSLQGHVKPVLGASFSPNGYQLATGDHSNVISQVKFEPQEGSYLLTASYDMTAKVWSGRDFKPLKTLRGHEARVTGLDIRSEDGCIATVSHDRTINLWRTAAGQTDLALDFMDPGF
ncbi:hypothetical protein COLO4_13929 [Corchorus olitorius]|uniref:Uncharacterized protein n=1 Tax=Corchorus olitorius TaxID=93759 RepID=A0A1R3JU14_9ROSI|nr:hypothetical protein COLO4_13929 [Corchorus olitorius]